MSWRPPWSPTLKLNNRPNELIHNHERGKGRNVYAGFSTKAPSYHLFRCVAYSTPRRQVVLKAFDPHRFTIESKAGRGGCSLRGCPGDAVKMNEDETLAYCEHCAARTTEIVPCGWSSIAPCTSRLGGDKPPHDRLCTTCEAFEEVGNDA